MVQTCRLRKIDIEAIHRHGRVGLAAAPHSEPAAQLGLPPQPIRDAMSITQVGGSALEPAPLSRSTLSTKRASKIST